jgi:lipopolysaccharide biosynthesis regulator YciM
MLAGQREMRGGHPGAALALWGEMRLRDPASFHLVADDYAQAALAAHKTDAARAVLNEAYEQSPDLALLRALATLDGSPLSQSPRLLHQLQMKPTLSAAQALLAREDARWSAEETDALRAAVGAAAKPLQRYRCAACGFEAQRYFWQCPGCLGWDSFPPHHVEDL